MHAAPIAAFAVLVFSKTAGFRHDSIPAALAALEKLGAAHGFAVTASEDGAAFTDQGLAAFQSVVFLNTTGDVLDEAQQQSFERYVSGGGGYVGVHAAADTEYDWPFYGRLVGAWFRGHPAVQDATVLVADRAHPATSMLPARWQRRDEWYAYRGNPRGNMHVLATVDERSYQGGDMGPDHPIAWCHEVGRGRAFYTGGGHTIESWAEPLFLAHVMGGIRWAAGLDPGDAGPTIEGRFEKVILDDRVTDPMELAVARDGRVIFVERGGVIKIWKPETRATVVAGYVSVFNELEDGLLGVTLDGGFASNGWIYVMYSPAGDEPVNVVSRLTLAGDAVDPSSEVVLLKFATQRQECCHSGGSLAFGPGGNLHISTGDNTSPFASGGYSPLDERPGRMPFDAQKSSGSTGDLRGKVLRITPLPDGTYSIPPGNLFPPDGSRGRAEIYAMGCRNPFRIAVDERTGWLYWGDVGPDSGGAGASRGPAGHDEFNQARGPGNFGWPYFVGDNKAYHDYDFESGASGATFDPAAPRNESPNRAGPPELPPAQPAWIWYPYERSAEFPELGSGGRCAMAGPVYHYDPDLDNPRRLPAYYDGSVFIYEWARDWIKDVRLDEHGDILAILPFAPDLKLTRPHDLELGPDGCLYLIEWGTGFGGGNRDARISRIEYYTSGARPPRAEASAAPETGPVPLTVRFSGAGTWDFDGDGNTDSGDTHTYSVPGLYEARLTVVSAGQSAVATVPIVAGNTRPRLRFEWPPDGGVCEFGDALTWQVAVDDPEDGDAAPPGDVTVQALLGHDTHAHPLAAHHSLVGTLVTARDDGHPPEADLFTVLQASYTDRGAPGGAPKLTGRAEVILQPRRKQAEHASALESVRIEKTGDPSGGGAELVFEASGGSAVLGPFNLHGIDGLALRVATAGDAGSLELRLDSPGGPLLGSIALEPRGAMPLEGGLHDIRIVFFERTGGAGLIMNVRELGRPKRVVPANWLWHPSADGLQLERGLRAEYFHLDDPERLPDFATLAPVATGVVRSVDFPSTDGPLVPSGPSDHFGVVLSGVLALPSSASRTFSLESDDGSRLFIDGVLVVDNDGLHAMVEKSLPLEWGDVEMSLADPGGTHDLHIVHVTPDGPATVKLNWIEFRGPGVAEGGVAGTPAPAPAHTHRRATHD